nr:prolyl endopeptidase-like [Lytechinus pictus]
MELLKTIFLYQLRVNRAGSVWIPINKALHTSSGAAISNLHTSSSHCRLLLHSGRRKDSQNVTACRSKSNQFIGCSWRKNTGHLISRDELRTSIYTTTLSSNFSSESFSEIPCAIKKTTIKKTLHSGYHWIDEYAWMQEDSSEKFVQYIKAENEFSEQYFNASKPMQEKLRAEMNKYEEREYISETNYKVLDDYAYYSDISQRGSSIFCRRKISTGKDQVVLDSDHLMELFGYNQVIITGFKVSPCQQYVGAVVEGSPDRYDGHIIKMEADGQSFLVECIQNISNMEFLNEDWLVYSKPYNLQAREVWRHQVGTSQQRDKLIFEEMDERFFVDLSRTKDRRYVIINSNSRTSSELWLIDPCRSSPETLPTLLWKRQDGVECYLDHCGQTFYALSNTGISPELKLLKARYSGDFQSSETIHWEELYDPLPGHVIQDLDVFASHCVLPSLVNTIPQLTILEHGKDTEPLHIELQPEYTTIIPSLNADINSRYYQFQLSSPVHPPKNFELDLQTCNIEMSEDDTERVHCAQSKKHPEDFTCKRLVAKSQDGTEVPITVFHLESLPLNGQHPMLVVGYGAYGRNVEMEYTPQRMALLSNGWVLAFCHVRGGGELGKEWYYSGRIEQKPHSFEDFESCVEFLHSSGFSQPALTAGWASSAGALLLGVLCNQRPELLRAAVMRMPFVDVLSSMLDSSSPLTSQDVEEWGDPMGSAAEMECISSYCPYHNLKSQNYPSILITSSMSDQRVPAWIPAKYVARLRDRTRDHRHGLHLPTFLLRMCPDGGHFGLDEDDGGVDQATLEWAFLHQELSLNTPS